MTMEGKGARSNKTLIVEPNDNGLFICADLSKSSQAKKCMKKSIMVLVNSMSWAFTVEKIITRNKNKNHIKS